MVLADRQVKLLWVRRALIPFRRVLRIERAVSSGLCSLEVFLMAALSLMLSTLTPVPQLWNSLPVPLKALEERRSYEDGTAFCFEVFVLHPKQEGQA